MASVETVPLSVNSSAPIELATYAVPWLDILTIAQMSTAVCSWGPAPVCLRLPP